MIYDLDVIFLKEPSIDIICEAEDKAGKKADKVWTRTHAVLGGATTNLYGRHYENLELNKAIEIVRRISKLEKISDIQIKEKAMKQYTGRSF